MDAIREVQDQAVQAAVVLEIAAATESLVQQTPAVAVVLELTYLETLRLAEPVAQVLLFFAIQTPLQLQSALA
jgi:hypothetical protein